MKTRNQKTILMEHIIALQKQQEFDLQALKIQYYTTINSFSTVNLLKSSVQEILTTPHLTSDLLQGAINMGTQYLSKTIFKSAPKITTSWLGKILQLVTKRAAKA